MSPGDCIPALLGCVMIVSGVMELNIRVHLESHNAVSQLDNATIYQMFRS